MKVGMRLGTRSSVCACMRASVRPSTIPLAGNKGELKASVLTEAQLLSVVSEVSACK